MAVPVLDDYTFQFGDDGVLLNADVSSGPFVDVDRIDGLDSATYRTSSKDTEGQHGSTVESEFESKRTIILGGMIYGHTHDQMESYIDSLKANFAPSKDYKPFYFKAPGVDQRVAHAKCTSGFRAVWDPMRRLAMAAFTVTLECGDTIIYGTDTYNWLGGVNILPIPGFEFNFGFDFDFGTVDTGVVGGFTAWHYGNRPAPFVATFTGDNAAQPGLLHEGLGRQVSFDLTLGAGDALVVDFRKRRVLLNGVPRRGSVTREGWFLLEPQANQLRLLANSGSLSVALSTNNAWW